MNKMIRKHQLLKMLLILLLAFLFGYHLMVSLGVIPYESLWGTAVTGQTSLVRAEAFAICFLLLFLLAALFENSAIPILKKIANILLYLCVIYLILNFFGYLRCDNTTLKILMGAYTLITAIINILLLIFQKKLSKTTIKKQ